MEKSFYIFNPHRDDFIWEPLYFNYIKRRALKKYNYIAAIFTENENVKLLIHDKCSGIFPQSLLNALPQSVRRILIKWELKNWLAVNKLDAATPYYWLDEHLAINSALDEVFMFQLSNEKYIASLNKILGNFKNVFVHLSHYYLYPKKISKTYSQLSNTVFCGDSDISNHAFFKKYFAWYDAPFEIVAFYISDRFKKTKPIEQRLNKIISTGTFHEIEEYPRSFYMQEEIGVEAFHYNRRNIYKNREALKDIITCYNSPWKQHDASWIKKWWNANKVSQKSYFQMDIVEEYNNHKYVLVGEEICGFPGIGTFEAMACGCVALIDAQTLVGLEFNETDYINYTGKKIEDLQHNFSALQKTTTADTSNLVYDKFSFSNRKASFLKTFQL